MTRVIELPTFEEIVELNRKVLCTGEPFAILNENNLHALLYSIDWILRDPDAELANIAGALLWKITKGHVFRQGNKRTAVYTTVNFLCAHGFEIDYIFTGSESDPLYALTIAIAIGHVSEIDVGNHLVSVFS